MAIKVSADVQIPGTEGFTGRTEDVVLPLADGGEESYVFTVPPVDLLYRAHKKGRRLPQEQAQAVSDDAADAWLAAGFGPAAWAHIQERIDDPADLLREGHLQFVLKALMEQVAGRPTTSSSGASRQPWTSTSPAAPSAPESASES